MLSITCSIGFVSRFEIVWVATVGVGDLGAESNLCVELMKNLIFVSNLVFFRRISLIRHKV